jgi:hypothetical protein
MHSKEVQGVLFLSRSGTQLQARLEPRDEEICFSKKQNIKGKHIVSPLP